MGEQHSAGEGPECDWQSTTRHDCSDSRALILNDEFILRQARFFAERIAAEAGSDPMAQAEGDSQIALGRPFSKEGKDLVIRFLERQWSLE
jgi:hypothetical protein